MHVHKLHCVSFATLFAIGLIYVVPVWPTQHGTFKIMSALWVFLWLIQTETSDVLTGRNLLLTWLSRHSLFICLKEGCNTGNGSTQHPLSDVSNSNESCWHGIFWKIRSYRNLYTSSAMLFCFYCFFMILLVWVLLLLLLLFLLSCLCSCLHFLLFGFCCLLVLSRLF
jgi:hypothetical protein